MLADGGDRLLQRLLVGVRIVFNRGEQHIQFCELNPGLPFNALQVGSEQHRGLDKQLDVFIRRKGRFGAQSNAQGHAVTFPQRIQRRVGDLRETLAEITRQAALGIGQGIRRDTVTHGRDFFLAGAEHGVEQKFEAFLVQRVSDMALINGKRAVDGRQISLGQGRQLVDVQRVFLQQCLIISGLGQPFHQLMMVAGLTGAVIEIQHTAGFDAAASQHLIGRKIDLPGF